MDKNSLQIQLVLSPNLVSEILSDEVSACKRLRELVILELVRYEEITTMHAASLMNMDWEEFVGFMGENGIPYFNQNIDEYNKKYKAYKTTLKEQRRQKKTQSPTMERPPKK